MFLIQVPFLKKTATKIVLSISSLLEKSFYYFKIELNMDRDLFVKS